MIPWPYCIAALVTTGLLNSCWACWAISIGGTDGTPLREKHVHLYIQYICMHMGSLPDSLTHTHTPGVLKQLGSWGWLCWWLYHSRWTSHAISLGISPSSVVYNCDQTKEHSPWPSTHENTPEYTHTVLDHESSSLSLCILINATCT